MRFRTKMSLLLGASAIVIGGGITVGNRLTYNDMRQELLRKQAEKGISFARDYASGIIDMYNGPMDSLIAHPRLVAAKEYLAETKTEASK